VRKDDDILKKFRRFLRDHTRYQVLLYDLFAAVRGPDMSVNETTDRIKDWFTVPIRRALFDGIKFNKVTCKRFCVLKEYVSSLRWKDEYERGQVHYMSHLIIAFEVLVSLGYAKHYKRINKKLRKQVMELIDKFENCNNEEVIE